MDTVDKAATKTRDRQNTPLLHCDSRLEMHRKVANYLAALPDYRLCTPSSGAGPASGGAGSPAAGYLAVHPFQTIATGGPDQERCNGFAELETLLGKGILDPGRNFREGFPGNQPFGLEFFQRIGECFRADPLQLGMEVVEPQPSCRAELVDDKKRPLLRYGGEDTPQGANAESLAILAHSCFITIYLIL